jgi:hypothetical protein
LENALQGGYLQGMKHSLENALQGVIYNYIPCSYGYNYRLRLGEVVLVVMELVV